MEMNIAVITQPDSSVIPENVATLASLPGVVLKAIVLVDVASALVNRRFFLLQGFGVLQCSKLFARLAWYRFAAYIRRMVGLKVRPGEGMSLRRLAARLGVPCRVVSDLHSEELLSHLASLNLDLIVSFSAPTVFQSRLLMLPKNGCINLHCSALPKYAGLLPSFWVLYHHEKTTGATVHYMDNRIDNGGILGQESVPIDPRATMLDVIRATKRVGGAMMARIVCDIALGKQVLKPNPSDERSYFGWPTVEQMRRFRREGGRLA